jgi:hypothetical protein
MAMAGQIVKRSVRDVRYAVRATRLAPSLEIKIAIELLVPQG